MMIKRTMGYYQGKPALFLAPVIRDNGNRFIIKLDDIWKYSEDHNEHFEMFMAAQVAKICTLFGIQISEDRHFFIQQMSRIADVIMEGIDELVAMQPRDEDNAENVGAYDVEAPEQVNMDGMSIQ